MQDPARDMARYQQIREAAKTVTGTLTKRVSKDILHEGAAKLGILHEGVLVLGSEQEFPILMDFCLHDIRHQGLNVIDRLLAEAPYPPGSDEAIFLEALQRAWYSCFLVESLESGVGVRVQDVIRGGDLLIHDRGMSRTAVPGLLFASRLTAPDNIVMTTGTALPIGVHSNRTTLPIRLEEARTMLGRFLDPSQTPEQLSEGIASIIRICLELDTPEHISYEDPNQPSQRRFQPAFPAIRPARSSNPPPVLDRYAPCPCGSGKKFKFCCGAKR
jgi:hypothetical protein